MTTEITEATAQEELIQFLTDSRDSLAAQNRQLIEALAAVPREQLIGELYLMFPALSHAEVETAAFYAEAVLSRRRDKGARVSAHRYADLLSTAATFNIAEGDDYIVTTQRVTSFPKGKVHWWIVRQRYFHEGALDQIWDGHSWRSLRQLHEPAKFNSAEAAFAYAQRHPELLGATK